MALVPYDPGMAGTLPNLPPPYPNPYYPRNTTNNSTTLGITAVSVVIIFAVGYYLYQEFKDSNNNENNQNNSNNYFDNRNKLTEPQENTLVEYLVAELKYDRFTIISLVVTVSILLMILLMIYLKRLYDWVTATYVGSFLGILSIAAGLYIYISGRSLYIGEKEIRETVAAFWDDSWTPQLMKEPIPYYQVFSFILIPIGLIAMVLDILSANSRSKRKTERIGANAVEEAVMGGKLNEFVNNPEKVSEFERIMKRQKEQKERG